MEQNQKPAYLDTGLSFDQRAADLVSRMTLEEKASQMLNDAPAVERLGIPKYNWWNECLHGVGRAGIATVFPQAIGLAAMWNDKLLHRMAVATSDEARAKHHDFVRQGNRDIYTGLTFWSPNINIFRDPRWGRGQETYGEDPYLTSRLGVEFIRGLQGEDPRYLKVAACAKHYAVHSGPEVGRHEFDAKASERDMRETYLPAFKAAVKEANVESVMGAYNRTNGEPCCASKTLLQDILRDEWGFEGHVVSDCGAICDIFKHHRVVDTAPEAAAMAVIAGCDLNCGSAYEALFEAVNRGLLTEEKIDLALTRLFLTRFKLGMFDPSEDVPYAAIPITVNDCDEHRALALQTARESMVLLKNEAVLPLRKNLKRVAVIGPNADDIEVMLGNYNGTPSKAVTPLAAIRAKLQDGVVRYAKGCELNDEHTTGFADAIAAAKDADVIIGVVGISQKIEGEEGDSPGDRPHIDLPGVQEELLEGLQATGKPLVVVMMSGSAVAINWADTYASAILQAWYPGEEGGTAIADVLFGDYNPGGRLPVTFPKSLEHVTAYHDYDMANRTYRYSTAEPLYPFGYGLSYTRFSYKHLEVERREVRAGEPVRVSVEVSNTGEMAGDEVVQAYLSDVAAPVPVPVRQLVGFRRIHLAPGQKETVSFEIQPAQMSLITDDGRRVIDPGEFHISVGGGQPLHKYEGVHLPTLESTFNVVGEQVELEL